MPTAAQIAAAIEEIAPLHYQESYDNAGFCVGNPQTVATAVMLCVDITEAVIDEAIAAGANMIISHHPVIFKGLKRLTGKTYTERIVEKAIKNNIVLYAAHTNIDSVRGGISEAMADKLGLTNRRILATRPNEWVKMVTFVPHAQAVAVRNALFDTGAGGIGNYSHCSWNTAGEGTFVPHEGAEPFAGTVGTLHTEAETRIETIVPRALLAKAINGLLAAHPYEEPAYDIIPLENTFADAGLGMVGDLPKPLPVHDFLLLVKENFGTPTLRYSQPANDMITRVAVCGGSGASLLPNAAAAGATAYVTADCKYHDFFDADGRLLLVDAGHYETEEGALRIFYDCLTKKIPTFAVHFTKNNTNSIKYFN